MATTATKRRGNVVSGNADMKKMAARKNEPEKEIKKERKHAAKTEVQVPASVCVSLLSFLPPTPPFIQFVFCRRAVLSAANTATCTQADNVKYHSRMAMEAGEQIHGTTKDISEPLPASQP